MNERMLPSAASEGFARVAIPYPALLVFAGYYAGAELGLALTFGSNPISVLWPPNAILLAALLLAPTNRWWLVLIAALAAHLLAELRGGIPLTMVLSWFVSNVCEAGVGAICVRMLLRERPLTFGRLLDVVVFIGAAVLATFSSCFIDSALVLLNHFGTSTYWEMWRVRFSSNVVASITLVPVILTWAAEGLRPLRRPNRARSIEAMLLGLALLAVTGAVFHSTLGASGHAAMLYVPLPLLLWAALRFGPLGASTSLTLVALSAIWGTGHGTGPLAMTLATDSATSVQLFLFFIGASVLLLAAAWQERRDAETTLRESEERLRLALAGGRIGVWEWDPRSNPGVEAPVEPVPGMGVAPRMSFEQWARVVHPEDYPHASAAVEHALREHTEYTCEYRMLSTEGAVRWVEARGKGLFDLRGQRSRVTSLLFDITERRHTEELGHKLARSSRLVAMGELTASIAHELNQPLSAIMSNVDAAEMLLDARDECDGELRAILGDIRADDLRASEIIRRVRSLTRNDALETQVFGVNELIASVLKIIVPNAQRRRVVTTVRHAEPLVVRADRILIQQVLLNLLLNAIDALAEVPDARRRVSIGSARSGERMVEIAVTDSGPGIAPHLVERIFESFYTTKPDGMGLGLSIARTLVAAQSGKIWAEAAPEGGATLRFTLPSGEHGERPAGAHA